MTRPELVIVALLTAPIPLVVIVALLRGYSVTIHFRRERRDRP